MSGAAKPSIVVAAGTATGAGTAVALAAVARHLAATERVDPLIIAPKDFPEASLSGVRTRRRSRGGALASEIVGRPRADVHIGFADRLPLWSPRGTTTVLVVQNPHLYDPGSAWGETNRLKRRVLSWWARRSARRADLVICSTQASRADVIARTRVPPDRVEVRPIPPAPSVSTKRTHSPRITQILSVADLYDYKRVDLAVDATAAFAHAVGRPIAFVHIGRPIERSAERALDAAAARAAAAGVTVERLGRIGNDEVFVRMEGADLLLLTSETESQGLPLAEAMTVGLPIVCRAIGVFCEQGGDGVRVVDADPATEVAAFAAALADLDGEEPRRALADRGRARTTAAVGWDLLPADETPGAPSGDGAALA